MFNSMIYNSDDPINLGKKLQEYTEEERRYADLFLILKLISAEADIISYFARPGKLDVAKEEIDNLMGNIRMLIKDDRFKL